MSCCQVDINSCFKRKVRITYLEPLLSVKFQGRKCKCFSVSGMKRVTIYRQSKPHQRRISLLEAFYLLIAFVISHRSRLIVPCREWIKFSALLIPTLTALSKTHSKSLSKILSHRRTTPIKL